MQDYKRLGDYFDLLIETESLFMIDINRERELVKYIGYYYDNIIDSFNGLEKGIKELLNRGSVSKAKKIINQRFSREALGYEMAFSTDSSLYLKVFNELKLLFEKLLNNYQDEKIKLECYNKINIVLNSLQKSKKDALYNVRVDNRKDFCVYIAKKLDNVRNGFDPQTKNLLSNIEILIEQISATQVSTPNLSRIRKGILDKLALNMDVSCFGIYQNKIVEVTNKCILNNEDIFTYKGTNAIDIYKEIYFQIMEYIEVNLANEKGKEYYKGFVISNINNFIVYNQNFNEVIININNLSRLFNLISKVMVIDDLTPDTVTNYNKLTENNMFTMGMQIDKIINSGFSQEQLESISNLYDKQLGDNNTDTCVLRLFTIK